MKTTAAESFRQFHYAMQNQQLVDAGSLHALASRLMRTLSASTDQELTKPSTRLAARALMSAADSAGVERVRFENDPVSACDRLRSVLTHALHRLTTPENRHVLMIRDADTWHAVAICPQTAIVSQAAAVARLQSHLRSLVENGSGSQDSVRLKDGSLLCLAESRILDEKSAMELMWGRAEREDAQACIARLRERVQDFQLLNELRGEWAEFATDAEVPRAEGVKL